MLTRRRPIKARVRAGRRSAASINFPQLRRDVLLLSNIGVILKQSRFFREGQSKIGDKASGAG
jgi:hypothetical protein